MKFSSGFGALGLTFLLATGATAQQHPMVIQGTIDEIKQTMRDRLPEGTRIFTTTGADADADDDVYSWELQTSKLDQVSTCTGEQVGVEQMRIIVLSDHDIEENTYGALHYTQEASRIFNDYIDENRLSEVPMEDKPEEMTEEAWYHAYKMGDVAAQIANEIDITATIFTVQIPTSELPGVDMQCNVPMEDMDDMMKDFGSAPDDKQEDNGPVITPPDMGGNGGVITPNP